MFVFASSCCQDNIHWCHGVEALGMPLCRCWPSDASPCSSHVPHSNMRLLTCNFCLFMSANNSVNGFGMPTPRLCVSGVKTVGPKVQRRLQQIEKIHVWNSRMFVICRMNLVCIHPNLQYYCTAISIRHVAREVEGVAGGSQTNRGHANGQVKP